MPAVARVVVDRAPDRVFDYRVPEALAGAVQPGIRVEAPFGKGRVLGYVVGLAEHSDFPNLRPLDRCLDDAPLLTPPLLRLAEWMAGYYLAPLERTVRALLPAPVRRADARARTVLHVTRTEAAAPDLARAPAQARALAALEAAGHALPLSGLAEAAACGPEAVRALEAKGLVAIAAAAVRRDPHGGMTLLATAPPELMPQQRDALAVIREAMDAGTPPVVLLEGVTGSGKTEVYLQAMAHALDRDQGAVVLVPEISLTPQTVERFRARFGDRVALLHSSLSDGERFDEWHRVRIGEAPVVVGARSALFAPVPRLGLIIVDEEHEPSYKQDEAPRYHARDVAVMRGHLEGCPVVLGTATPSLESWVNVRKGKYRRVRMPHRVDHRTMPLMRIVDMRVEAEREGRPNVLSRELVEAMRLRHERREQTILFLNRRGFSSSLICKACGHVEMCPHCSVSLTYHRHGEHLRCHLCGHQAMVPNRCPQCQDPAFRHAGMGTQRLEEIVAKILPKAAVVRMDADTTTRKGSHHDILKDVRTGKTDVLIGTQMIAKGLDFPNVTLVGVVFADLSLHQPDFRAGERTFQLLVQVAGRAGRGEVKGEVIVQTYTPHHPAVQAARRLDAEGFFDQEEAFRRELLYPPWAHLVVVTFRGPQEEVVAFTAQTFHRRLVPMLAPGVPEPTLTPGFPAKVKGVYRHQILLRNPRLRSITAPLRDLLDTMKFPVNVTVTVDVDAVSV